MAAPTYGDENEGVLRFRNCLNVSAVGVMNAIWENGGRVNLTV
jgi:hypothetical protein